MFVNLYVIRDASGNIRYVGKTTGSVRMRLNHHWADARRGNRTPLCSWLRTLKNKPTIEKVAIVSANDWQEMERVFIQRAKTASHRLLNKHRGGGGWPPGKRRGPVSVQVKEKIRQSKVGKPNRWGNHSSETKEKLSQIALASWSRRKTL